MENSPALNAPRKSFPLPTVSVNIVGRGLDGKLFVRKRVRKYILPLGGGYCLLVRPPRPNRFGHAVAPISSIKIRGMISEDIAARFHRNVRAYLRLREKFPFAASVARENFIELQTEAGRRGVLLYRKGSLCSWLAGAIACAIGWFERLVDEPCDGYEFFIEYR